MRKHIVGSIAGLVLAALSASASAGEPLALDDSQLDQVAAGLSAPTPAQMASIAALGWASSEVTVTPGVVSVIEGNFTARVGLSGSGTSFNHRVIIVRL